MKMPGVLQSCSESTTSNSPSSSKSAHADSSDSDGVTPSQRSSLHAVRIRDLFFVARGNVFHTAELLSERLRNLLVFVRVSLPERLYSL